MRTRVILAFGRSAQASKGLRKPSAGAAARALKKVLRFIGLLRDACNPLTRPPRSGGKPEGRRAKRVSAWGWGPTRINKMQTKCSSQQRAGCQRTVGIDLLRLGPHPQAPDRPPAGCCVEGLPLPQTVIYDRLLRQMPSTEKVTPVAAAVTALSTML